MKYRGPDLANLLLSKKTWEEVLEDDDLFRKALTSYSSVRNAFADLRAMDETQHFFTRLSAYVQKTKGLSESDLKEKWAAGCV